MIQPLISVIIPLYNKEKWVERAITSVLFQTYTNMEILIINDGSTDKSLEVVKMINDPRINIYDKSNGGVSSARNVGLKHAKGEYIAFLDADDEWKPKHLEILWDGFTRNKDAVVICDDLMELDDGKNESGIEKRKLPFIINDMEGVHYFKIEAYLETLSNDYFILSGSSVLIKSSVINKYKLHFNERLTHGEDVNYWIQLNQYGKFVFSNYLGVIYHHVDMQSAMNFKNKKVQFVPDYFHGQIWEDYNLDEQRNILKFLYHEYYKKAYQNRGFTIINKEFSGRIGNINIGLFPRLVYLFIRLCPTTIFQVLKKIKKLKR